jgi:hypothetical protein
VLSQFLLLQLPVVLWMFIPLIVPAVVLCILQLETKYGDQPWCKTLVTLVKDQSALYHLYNDKLSCIDVTMEYYSGTPAIVVAPLLEKWMYTFDGMFIVNTLSETDLYYAGGLKERVNLHDLERCVQNIMVYIMLPANGIPRDDEDAWSHLLDARQRALRRMYSLVTV